MKPRQAKVNRKTNETDISCVLNLDGSGQAKVRTGIGFLDHMIESLARHARFDLELTCNGDLEVDDHHSAEDAALVLGEAMDKALGERKGIARFGWAFAPMDEALARVAIDLSGRSMAVIDLGLKRNAVGELSSENATHFLQSLAAASRMTLHVDVLRGYNDHHRAEAAFKAVALALKQAVSVGDLDQVPSTKGVL